MDRFDALHNRAEELRHRIQNVRQKAAENQEFAAIQERYADLCDVLQNLQDQRQPPDPHVVDGLHSDFDNLEQAIGQRIEKQDNAEPH